MSETHETVKPRSEPTSNSGPGDELDLLTEMERKFPALQFHLVSRDNTRYLVVNGLRNWSDRLEIFEEVKRLGFGDSHSVGLGPFRP